MNDMTPIEALFDEDCAADTEIRGHLSLLRKLSALCEEVAELGTREGRSTVALIAGGPRRVSSYDQHECPRRPQIADAALAAGVRWDFHLGDSRRADLHPVDLLFVDTCHNLAHTSEELGRYAHLVRQYLVFHDTETYGWRGDDGREGVWQAIARLVKTTRQWRLLLHREESWGLTVLERV